MQAWNWYSNTSHVIIQWSVTSLRSTCISIQIHLMLLFNIYPLLWGFQSSDSNTSHVIIQYSTQYCLSDRLVIQIHLMLLFNCGGRRQCNRNYWIQIHLMLLFNQHGRYGLKDFPGFKYISCYYSIIRHRSHLPLFFEFKYISCYYSIESTKQKVRINNNSNTSHVIIQSISVTFSITYFQFKYISCYYSMRLPV